MAERDAGALGGNTQPKREIRFNKASGLLTAEEAEGIREDLRIAKARFEHNADESVDRRANGGYFDVTERTLTSGYTGADGSDIAIVAGMPARIGYVSRRTQTHYGVLAGSHSTYEHTERLGSVATITFNPEAPEPEVLEFDFDVEDPVEEVARLAQGMTIDGGAVDAEVAPGYVANLIAEAGQAVLVSSQ